MQVHYKCKCMAIEAIVDVPTRRIGADILLWMKNTQRDIAYDHNALSPECKEKNMEYAKIPMSEGSGIGQEE